jgi:Cu/Ag efflux pump CusA
MSLGLGEGGEQNAPLGRAVIGGLSLATLFTLFFVPVIFTLTKRGASTNFGKSGWREESLESHGQKE